MTTASATASAEDDSKSVSVPNGLEQAASSPTLEDVKSTDSKNHPADAGAKKQTLLKKIGKHAAFWNLQYYFVAQNWKNCDLFTGLVRHNLLIGAAKVHFFFPDGVECTGKTRITYVPPNGGCAGQQGRVTAEGTDGRQVTGSFTCHSLNTGSGTAEDSNGNHYEFTFGHSAKQAIRRANEIRRNLGCDQIEVVKSHLEVHGKVLRLE